MTLKKKQVIKVIFFFLLIAFSLVILDAIQPAHADISQAMIDLRGNRLFQK